MGFGRGTGFVVITTATAVTLEGTRTSEMEQINFGGAITTQQSSEKSPSSLQSFGGAITTQQSSEKSPSTLQSFGAAQDGAKTVSTTLEQV